MGTQGESFMKKTQKGLSILAFETTKQSRILKKRMRTAALQKEVKADLRDLGNLVYNAIINDQADILAEEEVKILVENIRDNKAEVEHLRDSMARLNRTRKHFEEDEFSFETFAAASPAESTGALPTEGEAAAPPAEEPALEPADAVAETPAAESAEPLLEPEVGETPAKPRAKRAPPKPATSKKQATADGAEDASGEPDTPSGDGEK